MRVSEIKKEGKVLVPKCRVAETFYSRFMGLMGKKEISEDEAVCFPKCNSIHTFFMLMPIDVVFVSASGKVVEVLANLKAWRMLLPRRGVAFTVELKSGRAGELGIRRGDVLTCEGVWA